jgi:hypothetical protein
MDFSSFFSETCDSVIMNAVGDDITLTPPAGDAIASKCALSHQSGKTADDAFFWENNIAAKIDVYSVVIEMLSADAAAVTNGWSAAYQGKNYAVSEVLPRGNGTTYLILNIAGNTAATANGWK